MTPTTTDYKELGRAAWRAGLYGAPALDPAMAHVVYGDKPVGDPDTKRALRQWRDGWHAENRKAEVR